MNTESGEEEIINSFRHHFGLGEEINIEKAKEYCLKSFEKGNLVAKGMISYMGWEEEPDYQKSFEFFEQQCKIDEKFVRVDTSYALHMMGFMYFKGQGREINYQKSIELYNIANNLGNSMSMYNLGSLYESGKLIKHIFQDYNRKKKTQHKKKQHKKGVKNFFLGILFQLFQ